MPEKMGMHDRSILKSSSLWVIKVGSALLTHQEEGLNSGIMAQLVNQIADLRNKGIDVVLVSSGSIAEGLRRLNIKKRPNEVHKLQAAAAVGQMGLVHSYELEFKRHNILCAQVLLTHADLANRIRYLNAKRTLQSLVEMEVVPIINENDTVVTEEVRGDNDTLGALVSNLMEADALVILTDQNGLYTSDPRHDEHATIIHTGFAGDPELAKMASGGGELGTGGMVTKLYAAEKAARSETLTVIVNGQQNGVLASVLAGEKTGTCLFPKVQKITARKQWIAGQAKHACALIVDTGAVKVLQTEGRSLLPIGIKAIEGEFSRGEIVLVVSESGDEIARGLVNYNSAESRKIMGKATSQIKSILGYLDDNELIHRDNLVVFR